MYQNPYMQSLNQQNINDRIDSEIERLKQMKSQMQQPIQPTNLTQNFQIAPTSRETIKYLSSYDEVQKEMVTGDTPFFSKDMSVVWIKNTKGGVKTYELNEIVPKDEKDIQIELLQNQINELKKEMKKYEQTNTNVISTEITTDSQWYDETTGEPIKEDKPSSVQRVSRSKAK